MASARLTKLQATILAPALKSEAGSIFPLSDRLGDRDKAAAKAISQLLKRGLISETACQVEAEAWRTDGDRTYGLVITLTGRAAIAGNDVPAFTPNASKTKMVVDLLSREQGATIGELIAATGWLPHTTRAALTGLRKKGYVIVKDKRDDATCYSIAANEA